VASAHVAWAILLAVALAGCAAQPAPTAPVPASERLTVFAAASLRSALEAAVVAYRDVAPGVAITLSTDSTATLRTQIEQGAPADVFLAADTSSPRQLQADGLTVGDIVPFARNTLAIVVPRGNPAGIEDPSDLGRARVRVIGAGPDVPISAYAQQLVNRLATLPGYPPGFADAYAVNVVSREDNVAAVVAKIELGEGDVAIVYRTDAERADGLETVDIPAEANVTATYTGAVVRASTNVAAATAFLAWLAGSGGQAVLASFGFRDAAPP
jgi:molybdate transport system substrate-binding protein